MGFMGNVTITCIKTHLVKYSQSAQHIEKTFCQNLNKETVNNNRDTLSHKEKVKRAKIKLAAFFAEHNVAFNIAKHLILLLKDIFTDSAIASDLVFSRVKYKSIITQVIAKLKKL